jgi:hypothetical protein
MSIYPYYVRRCWRSGAGLGSEPNLSWTWYRNFDPQRIHSPSFHPVWVMDRLEGFGGRHYGDGISFDGGDHYHITIIFYPHYKRNRIYIYTHTYIYNIYIYKYTYTYNPMFVVEIPISCCVGNVVGELPEFHRGVGCSATSLCRRTRSDSRCHGLT